MAASERNEIGGRSVEYWLNIVNQETFWPLAATDTVVLRYKGQDFFFVDGERFYRTTGTHFSSKRVCFLDAIGQSGVELLAEQPRVFRRMTGSAELAVFFIFRWSEFVEMLMTERGPCEEKLTATKVGYFIP